MNVSLAGKRVVITAGGAGMGRATALAMHKLGATVFTCDVDEAALASLPDEITTFMCDVSDPEEVHRLYAIGTSMQCYVDPEEIADMICFLCSDYSRHVSGQIIGVDGFTETLYPRT